MAKAKTKSVTMGNTTVEMIEENGIVSVRVLTEDAVIYRGNDLLWSIGNEQKEFQFIHPIFHSFLLKQGNDYMAHDAKEKITAVDLTAQKANVTFYFPENRKKAVTIRYDFIDPYRAKEYIQELGDEAKEKALMEELEQKIQGFKDFVHEKGWKFAYSHAMEEWAYAWADVIFIPEQWSEEIFMEIAEKIHEFELYVYDLHELLK